MADLLVAIVLLLVSVGRCPVGWSLGEGVRRDGSFACYSPAPAECGEPIASSPPCPQSKITRGRVYCTGGSIPIVVDERTVGCQARH